METILTQPTRRIGDGYVRQRHTPMDFYRNTFRREMGEFPFVAKRHGAST